MSPTALTIASCPIPLLRQPDAPHPERAIARGDLLRVRRGVYASRALWRELAPWDRYLCRVHAVALIHPDAVFCLESAAALLGMPVFGDPGTVHILVPATGASRLVGGIRAHRATLERVIVEASGVLMTSPADTAIDISRHRHAALGLAAADAALHMDASWSTDALLSANEARTSSRGRDLARWPLTHATALAENAFESISRAVIEWLGFPPPQLQVTFRSTVGDEDRVDFLWREPGSSLRATGVAGEADGDVKYDGRFGEPRMLLKNQSRRDLRLLDHVSAVAHWGWDDAIRAAPLRTRLRAAGLKAVAPENTAQLFSLRRAVAPYSTGSAGDDHGLPPREHPTDER